MGNIAKIQAFLDDKAKSVRNKYGLPNIAGVIVRDNGSTIMHTVQGVKDSSKSASAADNQAGKTNYFNVGSISKPITGFLIACLVKKGILSWDTKIKDAFPEFNSKAFRDRSGMNDTFLETKVFELISHSSGMNGVQFFEENTTNDDLKPRDTDPFRFIQDLGTNYGGNSRDKEWKNYESLMYLRYLYTVLCLKKKKYQFNSTKNLAYQNKAKSGYGSTVTICTAMAERKMGKAWELIMTELLFNPVQLQITFGKLPDGMQFHHYDEPTGKYIPTPWMNNDLAPYSSKFMTGGIHCTVAGMAQFIRYNLRALNYAQVFDVAQYQAPVTDAAKGGLFLGGGTNGEPLNHNGATGSSLADLRIYHHSGRGFGVMMNCGGGPAGADAGTAMGEMLQELKNIHQDWETI